MAGGPPEEPWEKYLARSVEWWFEPGSPGTTGRKRKISAKKAKELAFKIFRGALISLEVDGVVNYKLIAIHGRVSQQQVKQFIQTVKFHRVPEDMLVFMYQDDGRHYDGFFLFSSVQTVYGPGRAGAAHLCPAPDLLELADNEDLPDELRDFVRRAAEMNRPNIDGGISHALGIVLGDDRVGIAWDVPFALLGWFSRHGWGRWKDLPEVKEAIAKAAKMVEGEEIPNDLVTLVERGLKTIQRFEELGSQIWFLGGLLPHGYGESAEIDELLEGSGGSVQLIEYVAGDYVALVKAFEHPRVLLDFPDLFDPTAFGSLKVDFHLEGSDGVKERLDAGAFRERVLAALGDPSSPPPDWTLLSRATSAKLMHADPLNPPDLALLNCEVSARGSNARLPVTLVMHTSAADRRTQVFLTKPLPAGPAVADDIQLHEVARQLRKRFERFGRNSLVSETLHGHRRILEARVRGFREQENIRALLAAALWAMQFRKGDGGGREK
jgi:hypothetical protein